MFQRSDCFWAQFSLSTRKNYAHIMYMPHATSCPRYACHRPPKLVPIPSNTQTLRRSTSGIISTTANLYTGQLTLLTDRSHAMARAVGVIL